MIAHKPFFVKKNVGMFSGKLIAASQVDKNCLQCYSMRKNGWRCGMHFKKEEFFTIPNLLGYFRILLVPLFAWRYLTAESEAEYLAAALIVGISGLTDLFDGKIARRFHQVTELGKFLDPLADKLTQAALLFCLASRFSKLWGLIVIFILKEGFMAVMGLVMLRHNGRKLDGAKWYGKVCTALLYLVMFLLLLLPEIPGAAADGLIVLCGGVMVFTLASYIPVFKKMW